MLYVHWNKVKNKWESKYKVDKILNLDYTKHTSNKTVKSIESENEYLMALKVITWGSNGGIIMLALDKRSISLQNAHSIVTLPAQKHTAALVNLCGKTSTPTWWNCTLKENIKTWTHNYILLCLTPSQFAWGST